MDEQEKAFRDAILESPTDVLNRRAFADWLEENDRPEEADRMRKWKESKEWMQKLAEQSGGTGAEEEDEERYYGSYREYTWRDMVDAGTGFADDGDYLTQQGRETLRDDFDGPAYWHHWSVITGRQPPTKDEWGDEVRLPNPFSCSC